MSAPSLLSPGLPGWWVGFLSQVRAGQLGYDIQVGYGLHFEKVQGVGGGEGQDDCGVALFVLFVSDCKPG